MNKYSMSIWGVVHVLKIDGVQSGYDRILVLDDLSLDVKQGELLGLMGRNGAGKTTTLKTIMGEIPLRAGAILLDGQDLAGRSTYDRVRQRIAYVPQGRRIFKALSVRDNIRVAAHGANRHAWREAVDEMFQQFPVLAEKARQPGGQLSGGQQQLLALARALVSRPKLLLLDEPTEGLQPSIILQIGEIIKGLSKTGMTIVLVEQNLEFATDLAQRICILDHGAVVHSGPPAIVRDSVDLQHEFLGL